MIAFIGDVHRAFGRLERIVAELGPSVEAVIQVGDLGLHPDDPAGLIPRLRRPVYYITGNHDYEPWYRDCSAPAEFAPNLIYVPRGTVLEFGGRRIAFLGGGDSIIDLAERREGIDWWPEERVTEADANRFAEVGPVDLLVTHTPPAFVYSAIGFRPDPSSRVVERGWKMLGQPPVISGHLHRRREVGRVRLLAELEVLLLK